MPGGTAIAALQILVLDRPETQWVQLRDALANERISAALDEPPDPEAQAWLSDCRRHVGLGTSRHDHPARRVPRRFARAIRRRNRWSDSAPGRVVPRSHRKTVILSTPTASPNSA